MQGIVAEHVSSTAGRNFRYNVKLLFICYHLMKRYLPYGGCIVCCLISFSCATTRTSSYVYRVINNECNCLEYHTVDKKNKIAYLFRGTYSMNEGMSTTIDIEFTNRSNDTLSLELGAVKVSSRNISYQYNDKFLPLPSLVIPPQHSEVVQLTGKSTDVEENWHKIAGEQLTLTLRGLRLGRMALPETAVVFVPENPKLRR